MRRGVVADTFRIKWGMIGLQFKSLVPGVLLFTVGSYLLIVEQNVLYRNVWQKH